MRLLNFLIFLLLVISLFISYAVFSSSRGMFKLRFPKQTDSPIRSSEDFNNHFLYFPNISGSALPIDAYRASYYLYEGKNDTAQTFLKKASKINPYIGYSEYILADYWYSQGNIDSSYFYAKKAFIKWPKSFNNYIMYNKTLAYKGDTTEILSAYMGIKDFFLKRPEYQENFIKYLNFAKISYFVNDYNNTSSLDSIILAGKWTKAYDKKDGTYQIDSTVTLKFQNNGFVKTSSDSFYEYKYSQDTIYFYSTVKKNYLISKMLARYSKKHQTLILSGDPKSGIKKRYFKKLD